MSQIQLKTEAMMAAQHAQNAGLTQSDIALALGASQSQVSRILAGHAKRRSRLFDEVCNYAYSAAKGVTADQVRNNTELIQAIAETWDGSASHAKALATVIRGLGLLSKNVQSRTSSRERDKC